MALDPTSAAIATLEPPVAESKPSMAPDPARRSLGWLAARVQIRMVLGCYIALLRLGKWLGRSKRAIPAAGADILITGTFHSDNWVRSHLKPLAASAGCARLRIVATNPVPPVEGVEVIYPPAWLRRMLGHVPARLLVFVWVAVRTRPDVVGAFHMLVNGLVAALVARWIGSRSMYFCVGGPVEVLDGGVHGENRYFARLKTPDALVERWLLEAVAACDLIITMGSRAVTFFRQRGVTSACHVVAGGINASTFVSSSPSEREHAAYDAVLVARLVPIKSIDIFVRAIAELAAARPNVTAAIVGDGPLREPLERLARDLGIADRITFTGQQRDVQHWLRQSRVFVLTSQSEGLALSLMEAMTCGLPAVVSHVGDLSDLVTDGVNGFLVVERDPRAFARRLAALLDNPPQYHAFAEAARQAARRYEIPETVRLWDRVLRGADRSETPT